MKRGVPEVDDIIKVDDLLYTPEIEFKFIPSQKPGICISVKGYVKMLCQILTNHIANSIFHVIKFCHLFQINNFLQCVIGALPITVQL